ncbi:MAG: hypothetical protein M9965_12355 [Anaerolineae bacterium]|nr:hypothetical protein [Anaerolineae bacterium]
MCLFTFGWDMPSPVAGFQQGIFQLRQMQFDGDGIKREIGDLCSFAGR